MGKSHASSQSETVAPTELSAKSKHWWQHASTLLGHWVKLSLQVTAASVDIWMQYHERPQMRNAQLTSDFPLFSDPQNYKKKKIVVFKCLAVGNVNVIYNRYQNSNSIFCARLPSCGPLSYSTSLMDGPKLKTKLNKLLWKQTVPDMFISLVHFIFMEAVWAR